MKILHVCDGLSPKLGGPPRVIAALSAAQAQAGHQVCVLSADDPEREAATAAFLQSEWAASPKPERVQVDPRSRHPWMHARRALRAVQSAEIVHLHGVWQAVHLEIARLCRALQKPYVVTPHGSLRREGLREKRWRKLIGRKLLGYERMVQGASGLQFFSATDRAEADLFGFSGPLHLIPNGVARAKNATPDEIEAFRASVPGLSSSPYILFLSRLHPSKGLLLLGEAFLRVASLFPSVHLVLAGEDWGAQAPLEQILMAAKLSHRAHFVGPLWDRAKQAAICGAAVDCLPSLHEGFSMALLEAMSAGKPVVATENCGFPEIREAQAGYVTKAEPFALAEALYFALLHPEEAALRGERAQALVDARYRWPLVAPQVERFYEEALKFHSRARGC